MLRRSLFSLPVGLMVWATSPAVSMAASSVEERILGRFPQVAEKMLAGRRAPAKQAPSLSVAFPSRFDEPLVVAHHELRVAIVPLGSSASIGELQASTVAYPNVYPGADALYAFGADRLTEVILLERPIPSARLEYQIVEASGLADVQHAGRGIVFRGEDGHDLFIEPAYVIDAAGRWSHSAARWELTGTAMGRVLVLHLDDTGLTYPILIDPSWSTTATMTLARTAHTATLLQNGKVLVAGGEATAGVSTASCEIYDPASGAWSPAASLGTARRDHAALLLPNGKVLVVGGRSGASTALASAELYDPATGTWAFTVTSLTTARHGHTATVLPNGRVLVAAGYNNGILNTAELYDPATQIWSPTGSLATARSGHTATILTTSEKVLVTGGYGSGQVPLDRAELYDRYSGSWSAAGSFMTAPRAEHAATLLQGGKVLVTGGVSTSGGPPLATCEVFDPGINGGAGGFATTTAMPSPRAGHAAALLGISPPYPSTSSRAVVLGGSSGAGETTSVCLFDPATATWTTSAPLAQARQHATSTLLATGGLLVAGGQAAGGSLATAEVYRAGTESWIEMLSMSETNGRYGHAAVTLPDGAVLIADGLGSNGSVWLKTAEIMTVLGSFVPTQSATWQRVDNLLTLLPDGRVLQTSGFAPYLPQGYSQTGAVRATEIYNYNVSTGTGAWSTGAPMSCAHGYGATSTLLPGGKVVVVGGYGTCGPVPEVRTYLATDTPKCPPPSWNYLVVTQSATIVDVDATVSTSRLPCTECSNWPSPAAFGKQGLPSGVDLACASGGPFAGAVFDDEASATNCGAPIPYTGRYKPQLYDLSYFDGQDTAGTWALQLSPTGGVYGCLDAWGINTTIWPPFGVIAFAELYDPASGGWTSVTPMSQSRAWHSATLLTTGKVLVAGGQNPAGQCLSSAELFDPATGTWSSAGNMPTTRQDHTATLLADGRVLVVGGSCAGVAGGTVDIYDPFTGPSGTWTPTTPVITAREDHAALRLQDGRVLIAGGRSTAPLASSEIYDPLTATWSAGPTMAAARQHPTLTLRYNGKVLVTGGWTGSAASTTTERFFWDIDTSRRPQITSVSPDPIVYGYPLTIVGTKFRGDSEASGGTTQGSSVKFPIVNLRSIENDFEYWLRPDPALSFWDEPMTLTITNLPAGMNPGYYFLTVMADGVPSISRVVKFGCSLIVTQHPSDAMVPEGTAATFEVKAQGATGYQWQKNGVDVPGATSSTYTTPPTTLADNGASFRCKVTNACAGGPVYSNAATLTVVSGTAPTVTVQVPGGGEYWPLSPQTGVPNTRVVQWDMSDDVRICQVRVALVYSNDGGQNWSEATPGGGLPAVIGSGAGCAAPGVTTESLVYTIPKEFPSGGSGSLYKVRVSVMDDAGLSTISESSSPFFIVKPDPVGVKTIVLANIPRMQSVMGITTAQADALRVKLLELSSHPKVQGVLVDLSKSTHLASLYAAWDAAPSDPAVANQVLFGCSAPCLGAEYGVHDQVRNLEEIYAGVRNVVLVGDDRIIPMARMRDRTGLLPEICYADPTSPLCPPLPLTPYIRPDGTTVGRALGANRYLSDDPLTVLDPVDASTVDQSIFVPDLNVGRLVEDPEDIMTTVSTFVGQDGVLSLAVLDPDTGHKVLVTGYDFLVDVGKKVRSRWKQALGVATPPDSTAPVNGKLITGWNPASPSARIAELRDQLRGDTGGASPVRYAVANLDGHATHFEEGVPNAPPPGPGGLGTPDIYGADRCTPPTPSLGAISLDGSVVYAVGCHGGLPVPGGCATDADHSLDLVQSMLARGSAFYVANTGYGWGLRTGVGYSERLVELFTEELTQGGAVKLGEAVRAAKRRYYMETLKFDTYDEKCLMQWASFGLPMYTLDTGIGSLREGEQPLVTASSGGSVVERHGRVVVEKKSAAGTDTPPLPPYLTDLSLSFDFSGPGVYSKWKSDGDPEPQTNGCSDQYGCYYTLNGLVERATVNTDLPMQPYFVYNSSLSGTSQHGVIWKGGVYVQESGWVPVIGELISNGGDGSNHGSAPRVVMVSPIAPRLVPGADPPGCAASDTEVNGLVVAAGEAAKNLPSDPQFNLERRYLQVDLETFYYNNTVSGQGNCDRTGPTLGAGPFAGKYHQITGTQIDWAVPVADGTPPLPDEVWRVLVVVTDELLDAQNRGRWTQQELTNDGTGTWRGSRTIAGVTRLTYVVQAVDKRGNVTWHGFVGATPSSGVPLGVPDPVDAELTDSDGDGMPDAYEDLHPCLSKTVPDAGADPDFDYLTNVQEFATQTLPCTTDSDGGGDNDGSEENNGRDPVDPADDRAITILLEKNGTGVDVTWPDTAGSNGTIDGYYHVYRSTSPVFVAGDRISPSPIPNGTTLYNDPSPGCTLCFYGVWNREVSLPPPVIDVVIPSSGPTSGGTRISIYGDNFVAGATVTICGVPATAVTFVNSTTIRCTTPANPVGACTVRVTNPSGQSGSKPAAFTYQ